METAERQVLPEKRTERTVRGHHHAFTLEEVDGVGSNHLDGTSTQFARTAGTGHQAGDDFQREVRETLARQDETLESIKEMVGQLLGQRDQKQEPWMTTEQAADYLGMKPRGVRVAAEKGRLPGRKNRKSQGGRWVFKRAELDKWMVGQGEKPAKNDVTIWR